jgi:hypothetical protein
MLKASIQGRSTGSGARRLGADNLYSAEAYLEKAVDENQDPYAQKSIKNGTHGVWPVLDGASPCVLLPLKVWDDLVFQYVGSG